MQFPKINWLCFQLGKVEDGHFLTCKCCHHQRKHPWGKGAKISFVVPELRRSHFIPEHLI